MPVSLHYYIGPTVHSFTDFIFDWMWDVYGYHILFSTSIHEPFKPFQSLYLQNVIFKSDEEFSQFHNDQLAPHFLDDVGHSNFYDIRILDLDDSDGPE